MAKPLKVNQIWMNRIAELLDDMEFGSLHIVVHEGQIVQMERTERKRFGNTGPEASKQVPERTSPRPLRKSGLE
ncbi:YezD family protein [Paenibacillus sp. P96]|uniref:YezD family protein n=1 Tax=Paenibacillus zeirhizosphaerae TaxID=2987519 RepID=A0ABT9FTE7_9BACL|nr:YezD family protein [Paenibacillus sp. P96]MDP4098012.1 YezD family protein [Paenibacillus sp. P96]